MTVKKCVILIFCIFLSVCLSAKDYPVSLFGIYADGVTLNTRSIQFGIDYINQNGGGRLLFHAGRYLTGSIHLVSNVTLHLEEGAVLLGSTNPFDYDRQKTPFDFDKRTSTALIFGNDQHDIGITGRGVIDGQGQVLAGNVLSLVKNGFIKDPLKNNRPSEENRPMLINFYSCSNVVLKGLTLRNSACWVQAYNQCKHVGIDSIRVDSRTYWNNDGIDIVDCDSFRVSNSDINAADDGICLKSLDDKMVCRHVWIWNNTVTSGASAIKFGTASIGGFNDIHIVNNKVFDTYRSAIALETVDGGSLENVEIDSLQALNVGNAIFLRIGARFSGRKSRLENILFENVSAEIADNKTGNANPGWVEKMPRNISPAIIIAGLPGAMISKIRFKNIVLKSPGGGDPLFAKISLDSLNTVPERPDAYPEFSMFRELPAWGAYVRHARGIQFTDLLLTCEKKDYRTAIVLDDTHIVEFSRLKIKGPGHIKKIYANQSSEINSR